MTLWSWLMARWHRPAVVVPPVTPPEEHAQMRQRLKKVEREADRLERLADDYRRMERGLR